ncbi:hydrogenase 4 subunit B [Defluviicoccus vanus]|uniref:Hydrogenase 4 subunit B n=1 Tax=Defluviicoccus vanus TaxID=111831 RepID=A0A7H1N5E6_9PROT|nr:hydrogenase 4 subunit B [Defluviicoccus vanus]QNT70932.1 hydrogenase 4 subunit B [Defluviicoccus vanus]
MALTLILACIAALFLLAPVAITIRAGAVARPVVYGLSATACSILLIAAAPTLLGGDTLVQILPLGIPWIGAHLRLDALAAFFLVVVNLGGAIASLYAIGYGRHEAAPERVLPFIPAFLAAMNLVVIADDAFVFLFAWELMSLTSWALVMTDHRDGGSRHAGYVYLVMASFGTLCLLLAFGLLAGSHGGYSFTTMRLSTLATGLQPVLLLLVLLGAGSKAGIVPLHVWLPLAHPAAPSHVSALMSGVMTKVAVYGLIRIVFDLAGPTAWWWSIVVLVVGAITAVLGVLYALMQHDLKRLLAYHTVENIGIIYIGLGLALAFQANQMAFGAALALTAALFHVLNHSLFKSLLFLGTGAVLTATGHRDMERLGGLIHRMPVTALTFLIGCAAISALPPLNGFVSEWLTFQAILLSPALPQWGLKFLVPAVGASLALSAALAAACFVKAFGVTFLGRPRSPEAAVAREVDVFSTGTMIGLAVLCLLAGVLPGLIVDALSHAVAELAGGTRLPPQSTLPWLSLIPVSAARSSYNGLLLLIFIVCTASLIAVAVHRFASRAVRRAAAWDCGFPDASPATQYTAGSFAQPIRRVFGRLAFRASERVEMPEPGRLEAARLHVKVHDLIWQWLFVPIAKAVNVASIRLNRLQFLTIRSYLGLVFAVLVILLAGLALWQ